MCENWKENRDVVSDALHADRVKKEQEIKNALPQVREEIDKQEEETTVMEALGTKERRESNFDRRQSNFDRRIAPDSDRRTLTPVSLPQAIGRRSTDKPDKPIEAHPEYIAGAKTAVEGAVRLRIPMFYTVKDACREAFQEDRGSLTEIIRSMVRIKADSPKPKQLQADNWKHRSKGMRCKTCMFYVPKAASAGGEIGRCRKHAPTLGGWPAMFESDYCGDHKLDEEKI